MKENIYSGPAIISCIIGYFGHMVWISRTLPSVGHHMNTLQNYAIHSLFGVFIIFGAVIFGLVIWGAIVEIVDWYNYEKEKIDNMHTS